jgi:hypothetical protein
MLHYASQLSGSSQKGPLRAALQGQYAIWRKPTVTCVMSVDLSDRIVQLVSRWADFHEILPWKGGRVAKLCQEKKTQVAEDRTKIADSLHDDLLWLLMLSYLASIKSIRTVDDN